MRRNILIANAVLCFTVSFCFGQEYKTVREARAEAAKHLQARNYAAAQAPLEAALKLTPEGDLKQRVELYRSLMGLYRVLNNVDKIVEAVEFIQTALGAGLPTPPLGWTGGLPESLETCGRRSAGSGDPRTAREQRQKLFPIRLVSIDRIRDWSCFDAD